MNRKAIARYCQQPPRWRNLGAILLAGTAGLYAPGALAQGEQRAAKPTEEIIVTARKRAETVQDVPVTIGVVTPAALARTGVTNLLQLQSVAPGVNMAKGGAGTEVGVTLRGLGSAPGEPAFDSSVSLFVDGVYAPRSRDLAGALFDIDRIEVIRGTQAALLGKNTSLGAISLITRKPGDRFALDARASYEFERHSTLFAGGVDAPLSDTLKVRISGQADMDKGWVHDIITDKYAPRSNSEAIRAVVVWRPTEELDLTALAQHNLIRNHGTPNEQIGATDLPNILAAAAGYPGTVDGRLDRRNAITTPSERNSESQERLRLDKYSLTANWQVFGHTLTSISAYSQDAVNNATDADMLPGDYALRAVDEKSHQFSQELRIVSPSERKFTYLAGALYLDSLLDNDTLIRTNYLPITPVSGTVDTLFRQTDHTISVFGQADYKLTDKLRLTGGLRWTHETKKARLGRTIVEPGLLGAFVFPAFDPFSLKRSESNLDYSGGLQYNFSREAMIYVSYGRGTKAGGFAQSLSDLSKSPYDNEVAKTLEAGVKLQSPDHRWTLNLSGFDTRVDGYQVVTFTGTQFAISNRNLSSRGFELEANWRPIMGLRLYVNNTYADAKDRATHNPIPLAPKWSGSAGFNYRGPLTNAIDWMADGSVDYRSKRYYQQDPATSPVGRAFTPINCSLAFGANDDRWEVRLIGRNITNETELAFAFPTAFLTPAEQTGIAERGRTITLQLSIKY